jgi:hypothetical protein
MNSCVQHFLENNPKLIDIPDLIAKTKTVSLENISPWQNFVTYTYTTTENRGNLYKINKKPE